MRIPIMLKKYQQPLLIVGFPLVMSAVVANLVYLPALFQKPTYDFIYSICDGGPNGYCYGYGKSFSFDTQNGHIIQNSPDTPYNNGYEVPGVFKLYYYSVASKSSHEVTLAEANTFRMQNGASAPDGYRLERDTDQNIFFADYNTPHNYALYKGASKQKTDISGSAYPEPEILGWVLK